MKFFPMFYVGPLITEIGLNDENDLDKPYKLVETAEIGQLGQTNDLMYETITFSKDSRPFRAIGKNTRLKKRAIRK